MPGNTQAPAATSNGKSKMKTYPAKLLLFGEHTVNTGSQALAVPLPVFSGRWNFASQLSKQELAKKQMQLPQFAAHLERLRQRGELLCKLDVAAFRDALHEGLVFESNIPTGYGAGSSGALVAAVFGEWGWYSNDWTTSPEHISPKKILELKQALAQMESFFHGTSSGTDPLICFFQKPVLLGGHEGVKIVSLPGESAPTAAKQAATLFLLDTGIERKATPLIEYFLDKMKEKTFHDRCKSDLLPAVDAAIQSFLAGDMEKLFIETHRIGQFQLLFLEKMIPEAFRQMWQAGLDSDLFKLKVCGAGGGGFLLGITKNLEEIQKQYPTAWLLDVPVR
jgi:mevalonate kinase